MRYPKRQRAIAGVIADALAAAGETPASINRALGRDSQWMGRILKHEKAIALAEFMALANELGIRPATLLGRVERRLKG